VRALFPKFSLCNVFFCKSLVDNSSELQVISIWATREQELHLSSFRKGYADASGTWAGKVSLGPFGSKMKRRVCESEHIPTSA